MQPSFGYLDSRNGATFRQTLGSALASKSSMIQVCTWNDFGEGTVLEPTVEFGYQYLEALQEARRQFAGHPFPFGPEDLRLPLRVHQLRKSVTPDKQSLDEAVDLLFEGKTRIASERISRLERATLRSN